MLQAATFVFLTLFVVACLVTFVVYLRVLGAVKPREFPEFRRAMRWMNYDAAARHVGAAGLADLDRLRFASRVTMWLLVAGTMLVVVPVLTGETPKAR